MIKQVDLGPTEHPALMRDYRPPAGEELQLLFPRGTQPDEALAYFRREYGYDALAVRTIGQRLAVGPVAIERTQGQRSRISAG